MSGISPFLFCDSSKYWTTWYSYNSIGGNTIQFRHIWSHSNIIHPDGFQMVFRWFSGHFTLETQLWAIQNSIKSKCSCRQTHLQAICEWTLHFCNDGLWRNFDPQEEEFQEQEGMQLHQRFPELVHQYSHFHGFTYRLSSKAT